MKKLMPLAASLVFSGVLSGCNLPSSQPEKKDSVTIRQSEAATADTYRPNGPEYQYRRERKRCENAAGSPGLNANYVGECGDLAGRDLSKQNLSGRSFRGAILKRANLGGADLRDSDFRGADLRDANLFQGAMLDEALRNEDTLFTFDSKEADRLGFILKTFEKTDEEYGRFIQFFANTAAADRLKQLEFYIRQGADLSYSPWGYYFYAGAVMAKAKAAAELKVALAAGLNPNGKFDASGELVSEIPVELALRAKCDACVDALNTAPIKLNPNVHRTEGMTALAGVLYAGDAVAAQRLIDLGASVNLEFPLHWDYYLGSKRIVRANATTLAKIGPALDFILSKGGDLKFRYLFMTPDLDSVRTLVSKGTNPNQSFFDSESKKTMTILMKLSGDYRHERLIELFNLMRTKGLDLQAKDSEGETLIAYALKKDDTSYLKALLEAGVGHGKVTVGDAIQIKIQSMQAAFEAARLLLANGADIHAKSKTGDPAFVALGRAAMTSFDERQYSEPENLEAARKLVSLLKKSGADVGASSVADGYSLLTLAASLGNARWIGVALELGVPVDQADSMGRTAIQAIDGDWFSESPSPKAYAALEKLIQAGAELDPALPAVSPLESAIRRDLPIAVFNRLIAAGASPSRVNAQGQNLAMVFLEMIGGSSDDYKRKEDLAKFMLFLPSAEPAQRDQSGDLLAHYLVRQPKEPYQFYLDPKVRMIEAMMKIEGKQHDFNAPGAQGKRFFSSLLDRIFKTMGYRGGGLADLQMRRLTKALLARGLDPNEKQGAEKPSIFELSVAANLPMTAKVLARAGATMTGGSVSPPPPQGVVTPTDACPVGAIARGWTPTDGGCRSPQGLVWSMRYADGNFDCYRLRQGGRSDWKTPSVGDLVFALATDVFAETKGYARFESFASHYADFSAVVATGSTDFGGHEGPYQYCVAKEF